MINYSTTKAVLVGLAGLLFCMPASAQDNHSSTFVTISNIVFYSTGDPVYPQWAGVTEVIFAQPIAWAAASSCSTTAVAIRAADKTLVAAVQTALATGRTVELFVDDAQAVDSSGVCYLRAVEY